MDKKLYSIIYKIIYLIIFSILIFSTPRAVAATETDSYTQVYDDASLLSTDEWEDLNQMCIDYGDEVGINIYILTHNDSSSTYPEEYIEEFDMQFPPSDSVYFLYDLNRNEIFIEGYGLAETYIHSKRIDKIFDYMVDDLKAGYYYDAFKTYIEMSSSYMLDDSELNYDHNYDYNYDSLPDDSYYDYDQVTEKPFHNIWVQLAISLGIGFVAVLIMAYNSGGKMTVKGQDYLDQSRPGLIGKRDTYLRTRTTRVRKPKQNTSSSSRGGRSRGGFSSGGYRGGTSRGGRSHSSGGRKL